MSLRNSRKWPSRFAIFLSTITRSKRSFGGSDNNFSAMAMCSFAVKPRLYTIRFISSSASSMRLQISTSCSRVSKGTLPIWFMYIRTGSSRISRRASSSSSAGCAGSAGLARPSAPALSPLIFPSRPPRLGRAFSLGLIHDDFHVETPQLGQQRVKVFGTDIVRQNVIDVIVGDVAVLLREMQERPDRLGQIHGRLKGRRSRGVYMAVLRQLLRRFSPGGNNCARCMRLGFMRL